MAEDLRTELVRLLRRAWRNLPVEKLPGTPHSMKIPDDLARRIAADHPDATLDRGASGVPLLSRLRPNGRFEDDWRARPTRRRPWPVVLVHGTGATKGDWEELGADLRADGWAVFAPDLIGRATGPLAESAGHLGAYIDAVLQVTGAQKVVVVGHSQGGLLARWWLRFGGGAGKIRHLVCLSTPNHGTTMGGIVSSAVRGPVAAGLMRELVTNWFGPAGFDQIRGDAGTGVVEAINAGDELVEGVTYTCLATRFDTLIQPPNSVFLRDPGDDTVRNLWVDSLDETAVITHDQMARARPARQLVRADLDRLCRVGDPWTVCDSRADHTNRTDTTNGTDDADSADGTDDADSTGSTDGADSAESSDRPRP